MRKQWCFVVFSDNWITKFIGINRGIKILIKNTKSFLKKKLHPPPYLLSSQCRSETTDVSMKILYFFFYSVHVQQKKMKTWTIHKNQKDFFYCSKKYMRSSSKSVEIRVVHGTGRMLRDDGAGRDDIFCPDISRAFWYLSLYL